MVCYVTGWIWDQGISLVQRRSHAIVTGGWHKCYVIRDASKQEQHLVPDGYKISLISSLSEMVEYCHTIVPVIPSSE
jgi:hypothetical protein